MDTRLTPLNVGLIPEDWVIKSLGEVSHRMTNGFVGQSLQYQVEDETGVMYIQGFNVRPNVIDLSKITYVCSKFAEEQQKSQLKEGDLLTVQSGHIGTTAVVPKELEGVNCHALIITRPKHDIINSNYVAYYLNSDIGKARLQGLHVGSTILHINTSELAKYRIPVPMLREQREIVAILSAWEKAIAQTEKLIEAKGKLKKGLMQQLLTGKRRFVGDSSTPKTVKLGEVAKIRRGASPRPIDDPKWFSDTGRGWVRISDVTACTTFLRKTSQYLSALPHVFTTAS
jgi:type I restriction enzyme S subunit